MILSPPSEIRRQTEAGWWGTRTLTDLLEANCREHADRIAVEDAPNRAGYFDGPPLRVSYAQLWQQARNLAARLLELGVGHDDVVCLQLPNTVELVVAYWGCALAGAISTPVPVQYREHELDAIMERSGACALMTFLRAGDSQALTRCVTVAQRQRRPVRVLAWAQPGVASPLPGVDLLQLDAGSSAGDERLDAHRRAHPADANDIFTICWTSGTEGQPKGVPRSHNQWLIAGRALVESSRLQQGCRLLNPFPLVNTAGLSGMMVPWLMTAGTLVMHQPFSLPVFLDQLRAGAIDYTCASPAVLTSLLQNAELAQGIDFGRMSGIASGGAPLSDWLVRGFHERFGVHIVNCYGSNEGAALYSGPRDVPDPGLRAAFFPRYGVPGRSWALTISRALQTRLVDVESGQVVEAPGVPGELRVRGPNVFHGYFRQPELDGAAFDADGYYRTGDLFEIAGDASQFYRFVGRSKDIVIRGGFNISAAEIEGLLMGHPAVAEAAVIGWPDARLGERVCAVVVPRPGCTVTLPDLVAFLRDEAKVAAFKLPEHLLVLDALPRNPVGKVVKNELRRLIPRQGEAS